MSLLDGQKAELAFVIYTLYKLCEGSAEYKVRDKAINCPISKIDGGILGAMLGCGCLSMPWQEAPWY